MIRDLALICVLVSLASLPALPDDCVTPDRLIVETMKRDRDLTSRWAAIFGWGFAGVTAAQLVAGFSSSDKNDRVDLYWEALNSALGLVPTWIAPPHILEDAEKLKGGGSCEDLREDQTLIEHSAQNERDMTGIASHAEMVAVNLVVSLILGFGYGHWESAGMNFLLGVPVGELMILTQPTGSLNFWNRSTQVGIAPVFSPKTLGLQVSVSF